jgi:hypothetical protein
MDFFLIVPYYTRWHYTRGIREFVENWVDFVWFISKFFSLGLLLKTLFSPWERMNESYGGRFDIANIIQTFTVNLLMRAVGFVIRVVVLAVGFASIIVATLLGLILFVVWLAFPVIIFFLLSLSIYNLFK